MFKLFASLRKELLLLINDKVGLALMFLMPLLLVFIITIIQDSAYKMVNENQIPLLVVNHDNGKEGNKLVELLTKSGLFKIDSQNAIRQESLKSELLSRGKMIALYIPASFSAGLESNAEDVSTILMDDLGLDRDTTRHQKVSMPKLSFYNDPVLQENYSYSVMSVIQSYMSVIENSLMIDRMYANMDIAERSGKLKDKMISNRVGIDQIVARNNNSTAIPNSTQHNVPAWTIFAMFFMVVSLGSNIVKERINGSFLRLKTMPTTFMVVMFSKMAVYVVVAALQVALTFSMGVWILPKLGLPKLSVPDNIIATIAVIFISSMAAVSYALMIGAFAKTEQQANGFGAISIIIFGAIGGILVPTFVMPGFMQFFSNFSPLHWCLEGFYVLFLKGGSWQDLRTVFAFLGIFIVFCQLGTYFKLRLERII
ncbi:ABC-2 type transport system permease protein [Dyadobacter sp. BE34]|uniref:ABC-2 type transport system permease protein n=1 Tax=Dyadobacter fermentans TaxID=94254 RepID=A0ABU1R970_9BACT|nr:MULTISPECIES: ABC transporter permease [Dyadobacter]MDR6809155.1 ABC-2 type transport system permease protein [Dyadobacter fermentans]MDR7046898.1 ABC-2 type transport system permease protein [Dyadobacter sp. BE242]MDR7201212.1 ABC-2 type transport system permease protein [Dyadobacter sp. BE34]MDR7219172.1 ABC-2 type transport system permease protein [Dyadobacter sp. BE31]MDR7264618.1 ABC-2 type transport system permease protein [Dyadobacter sp. BE32]